MSSTTTIHSREKLAWTFLLFSFAIFLFLAAAIPFAISSLVRNATQPLQVEVQANQGTVSVEGEEETRAILLGNPPQQVLPASNIFTDNAATALLRVFPPESDQLLTRIQMYGRTQIGLGEANAPRFRWSDNGYELLLRLENGRIQLSWPTADEPQPYQLTILTPHGEAIVRQPGQYSFIVNAAETEISVRQGVVTLAAQEETLILTDNQRAEIPAANSPKGPFSPERNLLENSDFSSNLQNWSVLAWRIEREGQPEGKAEVSPVDGEPVLLVERLGVGAADVEIAQTINHDVTDYAILRLQLTFQILSQSLDVCGVQGSECPLFVRLNYTDQNGTSRVWQQGFYAAGNIDDNSTPELCKPCGVVQQPHARVQLGQTAFVDLNLLERMTLDGTPQPRRINSLSLVVSGHSFATEIVDVALIAEESPRLPNEK